MNKAIEDEKNAEIKAKMGPQANTKETPGATIIAEARKISNQTQPSVDSKKSIDPVEKADKNEVSVRNSV